VTGGSGGIETGGSGGVTGGSGGIETGGSGGIETGGSGGIETGGSGGTVTIPPGCNDQYAGYALEIPTALVLLDRSSSMFEETYGTYPTRWDLVEDVLVGDGTATFGVIGDYADSMRLTFVAYTNEVGISSCPLLDEAGAVPQISNYSFIQSTCSAAGYDPLDDGAKGETPTGAAIDGVIDSLTTIVEPGPKYLILITDGLPDTCATPDPQCGADEAIRALQDAYAAGIETRVVGVELDDGGENWRYYTQITNAGAGQSVLHGADYADCAVGGDSATYGATMGGAVPIDSGNPTTLTQALVSTVQGLRSCTVDLSGISVNTALASQGAVQLEGSVLGYDTADGWQMSSSTRIQFLGAACDAFRAAPVPDLYVSFPCTALL
jgi:hypothetical protein